MPTINPTGYCPHCRQNVLLAREDIDVTLAIVLLCCTFGIGLFIYIVIYYSKEENRCVHCGTICQATLSDQSIQAPGQLPYQQQVEQYAPAQPVDEERASFCPLCGDKLDNRNLRFCGNCGSKLDL